MRASARKVDAAEIARRLYVRLLETPPELPEMYQQQVEFVLSEAHHTAFIAGIGAGKSLAGSVRALRAAQGWIGATRIKTPNLGIVTAPTYDMLRDATLRTFRELAGNAVADFNKNEMMATLRNGSEIIFRSTQHPERLRGPNISWWWGDEAALYTPDVRKIMIGRLRQYGVQGWEWLTTTPKGRNWIWQTWVRQRREEYDLVKASSRDNVYLDRAIIDAWESEYTGDFAAQELDAEFVAFEGLIYGEFDRHRHVLSAVPETFPRYVAGVDWGFANPGVIVVVGVDTDGRAYVVREVYERKRRVEEWVSMAQQLRGAYRIERFYCDPAAPDNIKAFVDGGLPAEPANNSVQTGIQTVKNRLVVQADGRPRLLLGREAVNLASEFEQYQWAANRHGVRDEPVTANDHAVDALRYAMMGIDHPKTRKVEATVTRYA